MDTRERKKPLKHLQGLKGRAQNNLSGALRVCIVALLVLFQFAILISLPILLRQYSTWFYIAMEVLGVFTILALTNDNRSMSYKFAWLCIIVVLPISGNIMFSIWGRVGKGNKLNRRIKEQISEVDKKLIHDERVVQEFVEKHPVTSRMSRYIQAEGSPLYKNNEARYYDFGEDAFEDIFADLEKAEKFIFIEFFIVAEGALWDKLHVILKRKIEEGVEVKFLYDDFGALMRTGKDFASDLRKEGFQVEVFNPIHKYVSKLFMNFRDHQKIIVVDGSIAYTGGFNIADEYANLVDRFGVWKDAGIRLTGDVVWGMTITFLELWTVCAKNDVIDYDRYRPVAEFPQTDMYCHVLRDGPALDTHSFVGSIYKQMIQYAGRIMYIMTPYLILEPPMTDTLIEAARRGVDVRIITPHIPDKKYIKYMTEYNYGILLKNGIRIYEYLPGFIHSKVVMNEHSAIVGTINMDYRSFYLHYENGVWIYDREFLKPVMKDFLQTFRESREISYGEWESRPKKRKAIQHILHMFDTLG
ncbi:MAG: cardiolipin synthase [Lachnospiraceae bacterium]|nr:cardiolipin synthase [Lachnospiraceae bacterium]